MKQFLLFILTLCILSSVTSGQSLKGKITTQAGEPIQYSTVFIKELRAGNNN